VFDMSNLVRLFIVPHESGIVPLNPLFPRHASRNDDKSPNSDGRLPTNELLQRNRIRNFGNAPIVTGNVPENPDLIGDGDKQGWKRFRPKYSYVRIQIQFFKSIQRINIRRNGTRETWRLADVGESQVGARGEVGEQIPREKVWDSPYSTKKDDRERKKRNIA
jgi:hypothetical protein